MKSQNENINKTVRKFMLEEFSMLLWCFYSIQVKDLMYIPYFRNFYYIIKFFESLVASIFLSPL